MTTLVGLHIPGEGTWIGSDRQATQPGLKVLNVDKWAAHGQWAVGVAGLMLTLNLIQENKEALLDDLQSPRHFVTRLREVLAGHSVLPDRGGEEGEPGGVEMWPHNILLASPDGLWEISGEMVCHRVEDRCFWALGSGQGVALGAGTVALELTGDPVRSMEMALRAASHYDPHTGGPLFIAHLKPRLTLPRDAKPPRQTRARSRSVA